jgi:pyridoxamine 5'-phosphate oxidase
MHSDRNSSEPKLVDPHASIWSNLERATIDRRHGWRTFALGSQGIDVGDTRSGPSMRMVVLREVDRKTRSLLVYTDSRSEKFAELSVMPFASVLFWNARANWQLRMHVQTSLVMEGADWALRWQQVQNSRAAVDYQSALRPGAPLHGFDQPNQRLGAAPDSSAHFFAMVRATVSTCDSLELRPEGHRRAVFNYLEGTQQWVQP